jgi:molecular chaperone GrpE
MEGKSREQAVEEQVPAAEEAAGDGSASPPEQEAPVRAAEEEVAPVADSGEPEAAEELEPESVDEPEDELDVARREREEYLALAQRTQADFENFRKRAAKDTAAAGQRAKSGLVGELLPVVDNLERALQSAVETEGQLADGVRLVHSELIAVLGRNGVEQFDPAGQRFDPTYHEALSVREQDDSEAGVVLDVVEKGYSLNGTVLRPARVVVSG